MGRHTRQDDDSQTQTSVSWAGRPPFPPTPLSPSLPPPPPTPPPRRDADGGWRFRGLRVSLCSSTALRVMPFPHERVFPLLSPSKLSAGLLCNLSPPFELNSKFYYSFLQAHHPIIFLPSSITPLPATSSPSTIKHHAPSVVDSPSPYVPQIPPTISSVSALSPLCSRRLSWQAHRHTRGRVLSSRFHFRQPRHRRSMEW